MSSTFHTSTHIRTSTRRKGQRLTTEERRLAQEKFIKAFAMSANVRAACMAAGVDRSLIRTNSFSTLRCTFALFLLVLLRPLLYTVCNNVL